MASEPDSGCQQSCESDLEALRERAEKAEAERDRARAERAAALTVKTREGLLASEWLLRTGLAEQRAEKAERERDAKDVALDLLRDSWGKVAAELAEAREDIKALEEVVRAWTKLLNHDYSQEVRGETWRRIRDRKLLEVSE